MPSVCAEYRPRREAKAPPCPDGTFGSALSPTLYVPMSSPPLVHFDGDWSPDEHEVVKAAVADAEAADLPAPSRVLGAAWVATRQGLGRTQLFMASRQQSAGALMDRSAEGLAARIRTFAERASRSPQATPSSQTPALWQVVYESKATRPMSESDLRLLLEHARTKNERMGVTGLLLYAQERFLQVLEGPEPAVRSLYATIQEDSRHTDVETILTARPSERTFSDWEMGLEHPDAFVEMKGLSSFLQSGNLPAAAEPIRGVLKALRRFKQQASP